MKNNSMRIFSLSHLPGWLPWMLAGVAWLSSLVQSLVYLHRLETNLDEGAYLLKGYMFTTGQYVPYQEFGFWTNHMPLAFLIPGWIQRLFGPGLEVGRYFMVFVLGLSLIGLWVIAQRYCGKWGAVAALALVALNPALIKMYSTAVSQGLAACMLAWVLALGVGKQQKNWQILLAAILASSLTLVRINLLPVVVFYILYVFWQYGWRTGFAALFTAALLFIGAHVYFWPNILQVYVRWVPRGLLPVLDNWRLESGSLGSWHPDLSLENRLVSFFRTVRFHFAIMVGSSAAILALRRKIFQADQSHWQALVFMFVLFWTLFFAHAWVTLSGDYCNYCLEGYVSFFAPLGIVLTLASLPHWQPALGKWVSFSIGVGSIFIGAGIGLALADDIRYGLLYLPLPRLLLDFPYGRGTFLPVEVMRNVFPLLDDRQAHNLDLMISGVVCSLFVVFLTWLIWRWRSKKFLLTSSVSYGYTLLIVLLMAGFILAPSSAFSGGRYTYDCDSSTLSRYQQIGHELATLIPAGSRVYWQSMAATPLLYVGDIRIYPPQINDIYSFYLNGNDSSLLRLGLWNESLARQWLAEADIIVVESRYFKGFVRQALKQGGAELMTVLPPLSLCRPDSELRVYRREP
ncbi:MAG: hypothetical protein ACOY16_01690 [Chloroflexota bacterium]